MFAHTDVHRPQFVVAFVAEEFGGPTRSGDAEVGVGVPGAPYLSSQDE